MGHIGAAIQEVMESYEVEVGGKTHQGEWSVTPPGNLICRLSRPFLFHPC